MQEPLDKPLFTIVKYDRLSPIAPPAEEIKVEDPVVNAPPDIHEIGDRMHAALDGLLVISERWGLENPLELLVKNVNELTVLRNFRKTAQLNMETLTKRTADTLMEMASSEFASRNTGKKPNKPPKEKRRSFFGKKSKS